MSQSIKDEVIGLLTNHRELTSDERTEIDTLGVALSLRDNDPSWGHVAWVWAVTPRKEWIDVAHRALASEIRDALKNHQPQQPGAAAQPDDDKLEAIKSAIDALAARPQIDVLAVKKAVSEGLAAQKKTMISSDVIFNAMKDAAKETFSWLLVAGAAGIIGLCLFSGVEFGEFLQASKIQQLEQQVAELTAALAKK